MANWNTPAITDTYVDVLDYLKNRDIDAATMFVSTPTNQPIGSIKYDRANNKFQEWDGTTWQDKTLSIAGGGTGATTAVAARTALGIGTLGTQNSNAVGISGGTITGLTSLGVSGNAVINGILTLGSTPTTINDAAGNILESAIADGALLARNGGNETITGTWNFTAATLEFARAGSNRLYFGNTSGSADNKYFNIRTSGSAFELQLVDDTKSAFANVIGINRSGMSVGIVNLSGDWTFANTVYITGATYRATRLNITDAALNQKIWDISANTSQFSILTVTDAGAAGQNLITANRSGTTIGAVSTAGAWTFAGAATFNSTVNITGITTVADVLRVTGSAGLGTTESFSFASFASPNIGRIFIGDGTGYRMHISTRASSVTADRFTFFDSGTFYASGNIRCGTGDFRRRDDAGTAILLDNGVHHYFADTQYIKNSAGSVTFATFNSTDLTLTIPVRAANGSTSAPAYSFTDDTDAGLRRDITGNVYLQAADSAGWSLMLSPSSSDGGIMRYGSSFYYRFSTAGFYPENDNSRTCGATSNRWSAVWATNGTIQTSDITQKNIVDDVPGLAAVLNLDPFMFTWKNDKDGKKFAGVSAQDVEKFLGRDFVTIDRFGIYHMNYSNLIPVLIKAIQELYRRK